MAIDLFSLAGRVALVTGATSGIGAMAARALAGAGARVWLVARNEEACREAAAALPNGAKALAGDLSSLAGVKAVAKAFASCQASLHVLVNNAGALREAPLDDFPEDHWDDVLDLNLKAPFFLSQSLLPQLRAGATAEAPSAIVNIGSVGGLRIGPRETYSYAASKAGLHHLTGSLAKRLGPENITVNAIAPGFFPSRMTPGDSEQLRQTIAAHVPRRRVGAPDDIGGAIVFLASRAAAYVTGTVLPVDGGMSL